MLRLVTVGTRQGRPVIHWPGVAVAFLLVWGVMLASAWIVGLLLGYPLNLRSAGVLFTLSSVILGSGIGRSLKLPPEQLVRLD
ncbi:MAG TPA: hypothetical protein VHP11_04900 [Tepidisphaeraceae bacterium]|nr:hypothetical protein [Tepidisphaeraceae bacterium]